MTVLKTISLFVLAAIAEIAGSWLVWQGIREHRGLHFTIAGGLTLALYGVIAAHQDDPNFGRVLAAYGGIFIFGSLVCAITIDGFRPDRYNITGATIALIGAAIISLAPR